MSERAEIERAIAEIEGTRFGQDQCHESTMRLAHSALKEKLTRQENAPLTCDGCANLPNKYGSGVYMNAPCRICVRGITTHDFYKSAVEPKGEKE